MYGEKVVIQIIIQSVNKSFLDQIADILDSVSKNIPVPNKIIVPTTVLSLPLTLYDFPRRQYIAEKVNNFIYNYYRNIIENTNDLYVIAIVEGDGYSGGLNFVFGLATPSLRVASVYASRIKYGKQEAKFKERLRKLILHELGHLLGLGHCVNYCVMRFSNNLLELDEKPDEFCEECKYKLVKVIK
ncbi:MAG: archemetzincin [Desulfurococcales archaeon]|nr:archemetzincin [Desulfurococcales archaeon]